NVLRDSAPQHGDPHVVSLLEPEEPGPPAADDVEEVREVAARDQRGVGAEDAEQLQERALHVIEIAIDIGVVELDRREESRRGTVVEELRLLVEVRRIVLVTLNHEPAPRPDGEAPAETARHAADEQARV